MKVAKDKQSCLTMLVNHHHTDERCELFVKCKGQREGVDLMTPGSLKSSSTQFKSRWSKLHCRINAEWNHHVCDPREIRDRTLPVQEKEAKKPFPSVNNVFTLRRVTFTFKYHPILRKRFTFLIKPKAQITVCFNFRREFAKSFMDKIFMNFKDQNNFLNFICFIFIHLANKAFQITVKHQM